MYKFIHHQPARHRTSSYAMRYLIRQDEVGGDGVGWGGDINVHVQVQPTPTSTSQNFILADTSRLQLFLEHQTLLMLRWYISISLGAFENHNIQRFFQWNSGLKTLFPMARPGTQAKTPHVFLTIEWRRETSGKSINAGFESRAAVSRGPSLNNKNVHDVDFWGS